MYLIEYYALNKLTQWSIFYFSSNYNCYILAFFSCNQNEGLEHYINRYKHDFFIIKNHWLKSVNCFNEKYKHIISYSRIERSCLDWQQTD